MSALLADISINSYIVFLLIVWFDGDITKLFSYSNTLHNFFKRSQFETYKLEEDVFASYSDFLYGKYPSFITKLMSCPICLTFWLTLLGNIIHYVCFHDNLYVLLTFSINYIVNLMVYLSIRKLL
jgi:hypothetical protein